MSVRFPWSSRIQPVSRRPDAAAVGRIRYGFAADRADLILAGHTHGGQICLPGIGTLVTNCDLPRSQARGLSTWGESELHVSAGLGTNPYTPIRLACRPEATLLTIHA